MRKIVLFLSLLLITAGLFSPGFSRAQERENANTEGKIAYILFHLYECPHCRDEIEFINNILAPKYGQHIAFQALEVSSGANQQVFAEYSQKYGANITSVPVAFIDGEIVYGYDSGQNSGRKIIGIIEKKLREKGLLETDKPIKDGENRINIPILGEINPDQFSLPLLTVIMGILDGFNPCAMWTLVFLVSLLLGLQNKKRMWLLGSVFILVSGFVYFLFMSAWLNLFLFIGLIFWVRLGIGVFALGAGIYNLRDYWINKDGACKVEKSEQKKATFAKIRDIIQRQSIVWALLGIVILAGAVNLVELLCSAGLPAVYTQVLALNNLPWWQYYTYLILYIFFYMLDDLVVFAIAMKTLNLIGIDHKYARYSRLIGGIVILVIGILMLFKPGWLSFAS